MSVAPTAGAENTLGLTRAEPHPPDPLLATGAIYDDVTGGGELRIGSEPPG